MGQEEANASCPPSTLPSRPPYGPTLAPLGSAHADADLVFEIEQMGHLPLRTLVHPIVDRGRGLSW